MSKPTSNSGSPWRFFLSACWAGWDWPAGWDQESLPEVAPSRKAIRAVGKPAKAAKKAVSQRKSSAERISSNARKRPGLKAVPRPRTSARKPFAPRPDFAMLGEPVPAPTRRS